MGAREVLIAAFERFERLGVRPVVGGSFASGAWGQPRHTNDIDLAVPLRPHHEPEILRIFGDVFVIGPTELNWALNVRTEPGMFQLLHSSEVFKVDVFVIGDSDYERSEIERARDIQLLEGVSAWVAAPENTVLQKIKWYESGNRVSDRQWNDIVQVIEIQGPAFDRDYFLHWANRLGIRELAEQALVEAKSN